MAHEPCDACGQRFFGRSVLAYPALIVNADRKGKRVRLCQGCRNIYLRNLDDHAMRSDGDPVGFKSLANACRFCGNVDLGDGSALLFVTVYPSANDRRDYASVACPDCVGRAAKEVLVDAS